MADRERDPKSLDFDPNTGRPRVRPEVKITKEPHPIPSLNDSTPAVDPAILGTGMARKAAEDLKKRKDLGN